mgnify:CR=1 FL=1
MPVKSRTRAYLDDPLFLLNLACEKLTGMELPSGFYSQDWKYKIDSSGKKVAIRQMPYDFVARPLSHINYEGLDAKIMKMNLTDELNQVFKKYHNFYPIHLYYPIWEGFFRYANEKNILVKYRNHLTRHPDVLNTWWMDKKDRISYKIYLDKDSPVYAPVHLRHRTWLSDCIYDWCCEAHNSGLYSKDLKNGRVDFEGGWEFIPNIIKDTQFIWQGTSVDTTRFNTPVRHCAHRTQTILRRTMDNIAPAMLLAFSHYPTHPSYTWWIQTFKNDGGVNGGDEKHPNYNKVQRKLENNFHTSLEEGLLPSVQVREKAWGRLVKGRDLVCKDRSPKIKQSLWSPYFWKVALYTQNGEHLRIPWKLGKWINKHTEGRVDFWEKVKSESGSLESDEYYYKHKDWEQTFASSIIKEVMG